MCSRPRVRKKRRSETQLGCTKEQVDEFVNQLIEAIRKLSNYNSTMEERTSFCGAIGNIKIFRKGTFMGGFIEISSSSHFMSSGITNTSWFLGVLQTLSAATAFKMISKNGIATSSQTHGIKPIFA
jgi:hypothetical protein